MFRNSLTILLILFSTILFASQNQGYLGVSVKGDVIHSQKGLRIVNVYDDGAAWIAGLKENDLITHFNGKAVSSSDDFNRMLSAYQWGDIIQIRFLRHDFTEEVDIILGYEVRTKTYEILKSEQLLGGVHWYFDDNTTIVMKDGKALSITKKFDTGEKETFQLANLDADKSLSLPQRFRDLDDKLDVIRRTIDEQMALSTDEDRITFVKEAIPEANNKDAGIAELRVTEFKVYPNPSNGQFQVKLVTEESGLLTWDIYDVRGSSLESGGNIDFDGRFDHQFNLSSKFAGTYLLYLRIGDKRISQQLIIK